MTTDPSVLWEESLPGGSIWSHVSKRGTAVRFTDTMGGAIASLDLTEGTSATSTCIDGALSWDKRSLQSAQYGAGSSSFQNASIKAGIALTSRCSSTTLTILSSVTTCRTR